MWDWNKAIKYNILLVIDKKNIEINLFYSFNKDIYYNILTSFLDQSNYFQFQFLLNLIICDLILINKMQLQEYIYLRNFIQKYIKAYFLIIYVDKKI